MKDLTSLLLSLMILLSCSCNQKAAKEKINPGDPEWPVAWMTYKTRVFREEIPEDSTRRILEKEFKDLKAHNVDLLDVRPETVTDASLLLEFARKYKMKLSIRIGEDPTVKLVEEAGLKPEPAIMIGGVYQGKAIDRHLFEFEADKQSIIIEPPVYNAHFAYINKETGTPVGHYYPGMEAPVKAEIIVPLKTFDGHQHLEIIPAEVHQAPPASEPENDSATPEMHSNTEIKNRKLYQLQFDLTPYADVLLDKIGIAVYWEYLGYEGTWYMFSRAPVSVCHENTEISIRHDVGKKIDFWTEANGGEFPEETLFAGRWGDENFYLTGHLNNYNSVVNYPVWDYSHSFLNEFAKNAGNRITYPRTWGFPEIYGEEAYARWRYLLHKKSAELVDIVKEEIAKVDNQFLVYRNTTRNGVFALPNEFDGSGPELLTQHYDMVHLDPYVVMVDGYRDYIIRDMSYYSGLARRYNKPLIPWVQAITDVGTLKNKGGMRHPDPEQMLRMVTEHREQGIDGIMWLGYGQGRYTYPDGNPETWDKAGEVHSELKHQLPPEPEVQLAAIRPYGKKSLLSISDGKIRNPADYLLEQFLITWSVNLRQPYDIFEIPPDLSEQQLDSVSETIKKYPFIVSTIQWDNAWVIGKGLEGQYYDHNLNEETRDDFIKKIKEKGWFNIEN